MWHIMIGCGSYLVVMFAAIYFPAFFPKFYRRLKDWFDGSEPFQPPYLLAMIFWPITIVGISTYHMGILLSHLPSPDSIATWIEERELREQLRREKHADKYL